MADDNNNLPDPSALRQAQQGMKTLNNVERALLNTSRQYGQQQTKTNNIVAKFTQILDRNNRSLKQIVKTSDDANTSFDEMDKALSGITDQIMDFTMKGKKGAIGMQVEVKRLAEDMIGLSKKAEETNKMLDNQQKAYKLLADKMKGIDKEIKQLEKQKTKGIQLDKQQEENLKRLNGELAEHRVTLKKYGDDVEKTALALHHQNREFVESHQRMINNIKDMRAAEREAQRLKGGFGAIKAELGELYDSKMFQLLDKGVWLLMLKKSFDYFSQAYTKVGDLYEKQALLQRQYGIAGRTGMEGVADATVEAEKNAQQLVKTSARLHVEQAKVAEVMGQIQSMNLGIFGAKDGKDIQQNVRDLTDATMEFSRVTGVDSATALDMMNRRMSEMGMTAKQTVADMRQMTTMLSQMQVGMKGDTVSTEEMIKMIEKASATSGSFVVDTRLMTQAMRASANEAERLGGSKKLALEAAEAMGKLAHGSSGEGGAGFLNGPVANITAMIGKGGVVDIVKQGGDAYKKMLKGMSDEQAKYVEGVRQELLQGQIDNVQAASLLDQEIGATEGVMQKRMEFYEKTYGKSKDKYMLLAQDLHITDGAARALFKTYERGEKGLKVVNSELHKMGKEEISWTDMMSGRYENLEDALRSAGNDLTKQKEALKKAGVTGGAQKQYLEIMTNEKDATKREAMLRDILRTATDPAAKARDLLPMLQKMHEQGKTQAQIKDQLVKEYGITKDNKLANDDANDISQKIANGNYDVSDQLDDLGKTSSMDMNEQISQLKTSNSFLQDIRDALIGKLPEGIAKSIAESVGGASPTALGVGAGLLGVGAVGSFFGQKYIRRKLAGGIGTKRGGGGGGKSGGGSSGAAKAEEAASEKLEKAAEGLEKSTPGEFKLGDNAAKEIGKELEQVEEHVHGGGRAGAVLKGALALGAGYLALRSSGEAKAATAEEPHKKASTESGVTKGLGTAANRAMWGEMALRLGGGVLGRVGLQGAAKVAGRIVPGLNVMMGVLSTAEQASAMYDKYKHHQKVGVGDFTKLGLRAASSVPVLGIPATLAETALDVTGQTDKMNKMGTGQGLARLGMLGMMASPLAPFAYMGMKAQDKMLDGQDEQRENTKDTVAAAQDIADNTSAIGDQLDDSDMATTLKGIQDNTSTMATFMEQQRQQQILRGNPLPAGGNFNAADAAKAAASYAASRPQGIDESKRTAGPRPTLDSRRGTVDAGDPMMTADSATYNEAEDSVMVKFSGFGGLQAILNKKKMQATSTGQP